jgi:hypothetical protein
MKGINWTKGIRGGFSWDTRRNDREPTGVNRNTIILDLVTPLNQQKRTSSMYNHYRKLIHFA